MKKKDVKVGVSKHFSSYVFILLLASGLQTDISLLFSIDTSWTQRGLEEYHHC